MDAAIIIGVIYLGALSVLSTEDFIKTASATIALICLYLLGKITGSELIFPICILSFITCKSFFSLFAHTITTDEIAVSALIVFFSVFWLNTSEFIDGYVYSHVFVSLFAALCANILLPFPKRLECCIFSIATAFATSYIAGIPIDSRALAVSLTVCWIFCAVFPDKGYILGIYRRAPLITTRTEAFPARYLHPILYNNIYQYKDDRQAFARRSP